MEIIWYNETWGRGIQKICESCRELGIRESEYTVLGDDITIKFFALENAVISDSKTPKHQSDALDDVWEFKIFEELKWNLGLNQKELAKILGTSVPSVQRAMSRLKDSKSIVRRGGKRFGHWEVN